MPPEGFEPIVSENPFGKAVGPIYEKRDGETKGDQWVRGFLVEEKHTNRVGVAHGGVLMTFADIVLATAVLAATKTPIATIQLNTQFISPARLGAWIEGRAVVTRHTKALAFVKGEITSSGKPVADVSGIFKIL